MPRKHQTFCTYVVDLDHDLMATVCVSRLSMRGVEGHNGDSWRVQICRHQNPLSFCKHELMVRPLYIIFIPPNGCSDLKCHTLYIGQLYYLTATVQYEYSMKTVLICSAIHCIKDSSITSQPQYSTSILRKLLLFGEQWVTEDVLHSLTACNVCINLTPSSTACGRVLQLKSVPRAVP